MKTPNTVQFFLSDFSQQTVTMTKDYIQRKRDKIVKELVETYLEDCSARLSPATVRLYANGLYNFEKFLEAIPLINATKMDVRRFLNNLKQRKRARSTISVRLRAIQSFYRYLKTYHNMIVPELSDIDTDDYPLATWEGKAQNPLSRNEVRSLLEAANSLRDVLIIGVQYYAGLREKEVTLLKLEDIDIKERTLKVMGKGNKPRMAPYSAQLDRAFELWLAHERRSYVTSGNPYLFTTKHGKQLSTKAVYDIVHETAEKAHIQRIIGARADGTRIHRVHPHILRHSYATHAAEDDIPLNLIQRMMGHSSISTTLRYAGETSAFRPYHEKFKGI